MTGAQDRFRSLGGCRDAASLRSALGELCAEFGKVKHLDILTMSEDDRRRALCFVRLESAAQESALMNTFGVPRFGEDLVVIVDLARSGQARPA